MFAKRSARTMYLPDGTHRNGRSGAYDSWTYSKSQTCRTTRNTGSPSRTTPLKECTNRGRVTCSNYS
jgi:hypothetical protein